jgi:hypothetical protein
VPPPFTLGELRVARDRGDRNRADGAAAVGGGEAFVDADETNGEGDRNAAVPVVDGVTATMRLTAISRWDSSDDSWRRMVGAAVVVLAAAWTSSVKIEPAGDTTLGDGKNDPGCGLQPRQGQGITADAELPTEDTKSATVGPVRGGPGSACTCRTASHVHADGSADESIGGDIIVASLLTSAAAAIGARHT